MDSAEPLEAGLLKLIQAILGGTAGANDRFGRQHGHAVQHKPVLENNTVFDLLQVLLSLTNRQSYRRPIVAKSRLAYDRGFRRLLSLGNTFRITLPESGEHVRRLCASIVVDVAPSDFDGEARRAGMRSFELAEKCHFLVAENARAGCVPFTHAPEQECSFAPRNKGSEVDTSQVVVGDDDS